MDERAYMWLSRLMGILFVVLLVIVEMNYLEGLK